MANILMIDTTMDNLSVGIIHDDKKMFRISSDISKRHNTLLLPNCEEILTEVGITIRDIDAIACSCGPGSFTGIRLGVTTANGLSAVGKIKLINMNTLEILSYNRISANGTLTLVDAKHDNYYGSLRTNNSITMTSYSFSEIHTMRSELNVNIIVTEDMSGDALNKLMEIAGSDLQVISLNDYYNIFADCAIAKYNSDAFTDYLVPLYLRDSQAERELAARYI